MLLMLVKRILPFALTLALGIFIASFFVALTMPRIKFERRYEYRNECQWNKKAERAKTKRERLRRDWQNMDEMVPPPSIAPAIPFNEYSVKPPLAPTVSR